MKKKSKAIINYNFKHAYELKISAFCMNDADHLKHFISFINKRGFHDQETKNA